MAFPQDLFSGFEDHVTEALLKDLRLEICYLAFEGGGGRGAAFLGALRVLRQCDIIAFRKDSGTKAQRLDEAKTLGVSGASAGAITACLLAAGYDDNDLQKILTSDAMAKLYDDANVLCVPVLPVSRKSISPITLLENDIGVPAAMGTAAAKYLGAVTLTDQSIRIILASLKTHISGHLIKKLAADYSAYLESLLWDMGLLSGDKLRTFIDQKLQEKFGERNVTLKRLFKLTNGIHLRVAATCLNTKEQVWFDHQDPWGEMCVADAVRISAGFPFAFKPVAIPWGYQEDKNKVKLEECMLFVDGGVLNNLPLHAFDDVNMPIKKRARPKIEAMLFGGSKSLPMKIPMFNEKVLGLRLTEPSVQPRFMSNMIGMGLGLLDCLETPSEEFQVRSQVEKDRTIDLDTTGLSLLEFVVDAAALPDVEKRTREQTLDWIREKLRVLYGKYHDPSAPITPPSD